MRQSHTAIVERDVLWSGTFETEPYEAGWAGEAIFFFAHSKPPVICKGHKLVFRSPPMVCDGVMRERSFLFVMRLMVLRLSG